MRHTAGVICLPPIGLVPSFFDVASASAPERVQPGRYRRSAVGAPDRSVKRRSSYMCGLCVPPGCEHAQYLSIQPHGFPCDYYGDVEHRCTCSPMLISRYQKRLSGPLLDRIDIHVEVPRVPFQKLSDERRGEPAAALRARVEAARARQSTRFANTKDGQGANLTTNADMGPTQVRDHCPVDETGRHTEGARRGHAPDESERAGLSPGAQAGADDRGPGGSRTDSARAFGGGDPVSAAKTRVAHGVRFAQTICSVLGRWVVRLDVLEPAAHEPRREPGCRDHG